MDTNKENDSQGKDVDEGESSKNLLGNNSSQEVGDTVKEAVVAANSEEKSSTLPKVLGVLSLGIAGLAIFLSLAVMRKVDNNFGKVNSSIKEIKTNTSSLKNEMNEKFGYVDFEIDGIQSQMKKNQRMAAIMELKRALVTVQEVANTEKSSELQTRSNQLISSIESYLQDLGETKKPAGTIEVKEAPENVSKN